MSEKKVYDIPSHKVQDTPNTPDIGYSKLYAKTDGWYFLDDAGIEQKIAAGNVLSGGITDRLAFWSNPNTIGNADWELSLGDIRPVSAGLKLGGSAAANRLDTIFTEKIDFSSSFIFFENGTERARFFNGDFGLGTAAPTNKLHIVADSGIKFESTTGGYGSMIFKPYSPSQLYSSLLFQDSEEIRVGGNFGTDAGKIRFVNNLGNIKVGINTNNPLVTFQLGESGGSSQVQINGGGGFDETLGIQAHKVSGYLHTFYNKDYSRSFARYGQDGQGAGTNASAAFMDGSLTAYHVNNTNYRIGFGSHYSGDAALITSRHNMAVTGSDAFLGWTDTYNSIIIDSVKNSGYTEPYIEFTGGNGVGATNTGGFRFHTTQNSWIGVAGSGTVGNFGVGNSSPLAKLDVKGTGTTSATAAFRVQNAASAILMGISDNGAFVSNVYDTDYYVNLIGSLGHYKLTTSWGDSFEATSPGAFVFNTGINKGTSEESGVTNVFSTNFNVAAPWNVVANKILVGAIGTEAGTITGLKIKKSGFTNTNATFYSATFLDGNVGIGTSTPTDTLHIVGSFKLVDGNQSVGKILISDANGVASWQTPAIVAPNTQTDVSLSASGDNVSTVGTSYLRVQATGGNQDITGFANGTAGKRLIVTCYGTNQVHLQHQNTSSSVGNRINTGSVGVQNSMSPGDTLELVYDAVDGQWNIINHGA